MLQMDQEKNSNETKSVRFSSSDSLQNGDNHSVNLKLMTSRLDNAIEEAMLPRLELIIDHLQSRQNMMSTMFDEIGSDIINQRSPKANSSNTSVPIDNCESISIKVKPSPQKDPNVTHKFSAQNYDVLLKNLMDLVSQLLNIPDQSANQLFLEKAAVYILWTIYDVYNVTGIFRNYNPNISDQHQMNSTENYSSLEYVFCRDQFNQIILERVSSVCRSLIDLMDQNFLNSIFFYSSLIKKICVDIQEQNNDSNWFVSFQNDLLQNDISLERFNPFDKDFVPITSEERQSYEEAVQDLRKFKADSMNSDFLLQNLIDNDIHLELKDSSKTNLSSNFKAKVVEKSMFEVEDTSDQCNSIEDAMTMLSTELNTFIMTYNSTHPEPYYLQFDELFNMIFNAIIENTSDENMVSELTNLLGEDSAQLISKIITFYKPNIKRLNSPVNDSKPKSNNNFNDRPVIQTQAVWQMISKKRGTGSKVVMPSVVVHTEKEKGLKKEMKKIEKKFTKEWNKSLKGNINDLDNGTEKLTLLDLERMRENNLRATVRAALEPKLKPKPQQPVEKYPFVFDLFQTIKTTASYVADTKILLPQGFEKRDFRTHDEFIIPIMSSSDETKEFLSSFKQIEIVHTDDFIRTAFKGFEKLNLIQSTVFQTAYLTDNQNMLICAPTGAGKTNIAMLSILNVLKSYSVDDTPNTIKHEQYKIVYIAPMKALCAEMTNTFGKRLAPFGVKVRELTGDMQLTSKEIMETQMLVVTPEKWDIVTRKSVGDVQLLDLVRLIILDEVHLLQSDRGHVVETIVARTIRYVEHAQKCIRLVGLSATLPNYIDVAQFLHVDLHKGLFMFDERFRPVPLLKTFIGCKGTNKLQLNNEMDEITFNKAKDILMREHQVMVFVHSRNATMLLANYLLEQSQYAKPGQEGLSYIFKADTDRLPGSDKLIARARYRNLNKFLLNGLGIHHAGMPRAERNIVEKLFGAGVIKVLVCTSTLAWGVNLPAHAVIIRGTEYYDPSQGGMVDIDMLDVMQIFGRAGRPQFDTDGEATIITTHARLTHYLNMLTNQLPIESRFLKRLTDNLNAEIVLGTVSNISEAVTWLRYTYAYIRMQKNPVEYGLKMISTYDQGILIEHLQSLVRSSAEQLDRAQMIRYNADVEGLLDPTHLGRIASHYYIQHETIVHFNETLREGMDVGHVLDMLSKAHEFEQLRCREEEIEELDTLRNQCWFIAKGDISNTHTKVNILMQATIGRMQTNAHSLFSDSNYILQNTSRLTRGLFEYALKRGWPLLAERFLSASLMFEKQIWFYDTPLWQFESELPMDVLQKLSMLHQRNQLTLDDIHAYSANEIGDLIRHKKYGSTVKRLTSLIPYCEIEATVKPITRTILTVYVDVKPNFTWDDKFHGKTGQVFWLWLTDTQNNHIYHAELGRITKKQVVKEEVQHYIFTIPLLDAKYLQQQYLLHMTFEYWLGSEHDVEVSCGNILLPDKHFPLTKLLDLMPLPVEALQNPIYQSAYRFTHFNPIQTQIFHTLYHSDNNVLLGAPTGSGKTIAAELAMFRVFNTKPGHKIVYIAPLKALVRERVDDWKIKIERDMGKRVVELTGDVTPDIGTILSADVIVTTPEKWDGVSRGWPSRRYVREVALIVIDEIHLLGEDRGPVLEVIVSRTNFICRRTSDRIRIVGLSTAVANAQDLASWLNIKQVGLYNFSPSVRPVPIEVHVSGFAGKHYCPRMASMNKPAFRAIKKYSPEKPVIVFVSSRRQTRLTALDLITLIAGDPNSSNTQYMRIDHDELDNVLDCIRDANLKHTLSFGIGMHHAGLRESDRKIVEQLFAEQKIQILITTATLAWGVNLPAHAVIIKGTEFFDGKKGRYVDFPITDVLQMIGRAGRPQFDTSATAVLFVHDIKKEYYKKFLYEPFPVESHLLEVFPDHLNAEIMAGTVQSKHEAMEYLSSTYLYHRILKNPSYYGVDLSGVPTNETGTHSELAINTEVIKFLSEFIDKCVQSLADDYCVRITESEEDDGDKLESEQKIISTPLGKISSYYYLTHSTVRLFQDNFGASVNETGVYSPPHLSLTEVLDLLTQATEYAPLPVRHNEELLNEELSKSVPIKLHRRSMESPHTKANLLIQAHCSRLPLPIVDYYTDLKSVLDQAIRVIQSMIDISAINGSLPTTLNIINLQQCILQASWQNSNQLLMLLETENTPEAYTENQLNDATSFYEDRENQNISLITDIRRLPPDLCLIPFLLEIIYSNPKNSTRTLQETFSKFNLQNNIISRLQKSLQQLPLISLETINIATENGENFTIAKEETFKPVNNINWLKLKAKTSYLIRCRFRKKQLGKSRTQKAFCPKFAKPKSESWYLVLGLPESSELVTISRVPIINYHSTEVQLQFCTPDCGRSMYQLYLLSDCYIGLDQQYRLPIET